MFSKFVQPGMLKENLAFIRFGKGPEKVVVFPPINDALFDAAQVGRYIQRLFAPLTKTMEVIAVSRKRNLPVGYTTREMAADYARALEEIGPAHVIGVSLGGMIAQHFAQDYPACVKKLILVASAYRMGPEGLIIARRWIPWARMGMWKEIYQDTVELSYRGWQNIACQLITPYVVAQCAKIEDPSDFITAGQAGIIHDAQAGLETMRIPTLLIAGTADRFFPEALFYEMGERMPDARLMIFKGARHGVLEDQRCRAMHVIQDFIRP